MEYKKENIIGYEEYQIDTDGIIYSKNGKPLKYSINHNGYCIVNLIVNHKRKGFGVHTLVATQFISKNIDKTQVNHKDGNKTNNCVDNLEWVTPVENMQHSINVLGNNFGAKNWRAKPIRGINKEDNTIIEFSALSEGARYLSQKHNLKFETTKYCLWKALVGKMKTYKNYYWNYI